MSSKEPEEGFDDILAELDREEARIRVRMEMRRFGKPTTVVEGLKMNDPIDRHPWNTGFVPIVPDTPPTTVSDAPSV